MCIVVIRDKFKTLENFRRREEALHSMGDTKITLDLGCESITFSFSLDQDSYRGYHSEPSASALLVESFLLTCADVGARLPGSWGIVFPNDVGYSDDRC